MNTCPHCGAPLPAESLLDRQLLALCMVLVGAFGVIVCALMVLVELFGF